MPDLLLELFSEEIPARMQRRAGEDLRKLVTDALVERGFLYEGARAFVTPRRLALHVAGLPPKGQDVREERRGPRVGAPENAIQGFLKSAGLASIDEARVERDPKKGEFYIASIERPGRPTPEVLAEILPGIVKTFPWPKAMRWGAASREPGSLRWVRPLHSIVCTFGPETEEPEVVRFAVDGIEAGDVTRGHRFLAPGEIRVRRLADYAASLERAKVVLDAERRRDIILHDARDLAFARGLELVEDEALLEEVAGLVEWPRVLMGGFDPSFLALPPEVIRATIRANQKCFVLRSPGASPLPGGEVGPQGRVRGDGLSGDTSPPHPDASRPTSPRRGEVETALAPAFILVSNLEASDGGAAIVAGNERVVRARLADAKFFWDTDRKIPLEDRLEKLKSIVFHEKLGTQYERLDRIAALARELAPTVGADPALAERAARLAKADLVTEMVGEFPELQGLMGRYYAADQGEPPSVAAAIEEHYKPLGPSDRVPTDPVSIAVALADKLDTLVGFWAIDEKPTGSKDPFALRRAALGVVRLVLEHKSRLHVGEAIVRHILDWLTRIDVFEISQAFLAYDRSEANEDLLRLAEASRSVTIAALVLCPTAERLEQIRALDMKGFDPVTPRESWISRVDDFTLWQGRVEELRQGGADLDVLWDIDALGQPLARWAAGIRDDLLSFLTDRLKTHLRDQGARHDLIDAILAPGPSPSPRASGGEGLGVGGRPAPTPAIERAETPPTPALPAASGGRGVAPQDDLLMIVRRVEALGRFLETGDGQNLVAGTKRAANILRIEEKRDGRPYDDEPDRTLIDSQGQPEEKALAAALDHARAEARAAIATEDFEGAMLALSRLRAPVDAFFERVTVNVEDAALRANRLKLLNALRAATREVADFSKIGG